ncbi:MAG: zinc-ribbon domain-containing protein [Phycisphaeraceae bacterium]|nr:zinc-ribbon domain-containing protein [Phycisphaeraceae bacterium]
MPSSESEHVTCPDCGKAYRWQPSLVGKSVPCKQCGTSFEIPDRPGKGVLPKPADDGIYELAADPDDEPEQPPAYVVPKAPPAEQQAAPAAEPVVETGSADVAEESADAEADDPSEPQVHLSEAAKTARREAQRIAAAESEAERSWRDYKSLIIVIALLVLFGIIYWAMVAFSDAMDEGLHNTMRDRPAVLALSDFSHHG